jgi:hypothetical protein
MIWLKFPCVVTAMAAGLIASPATAYAVCGDPDQAPCTGPVPTVDQVTAIMDRLTDPNVPAPDKSDIVTPAFTDDELHKVDCMNQRHPGGPWIVTDIQSAPNNFAGATVAKPPGWRVPRPDPIVLVDQNGHWMITHRSAYYLLTYFYIGQSALKSWPVCTF